MSGLVTSSNILLISSFSYQFITESNGPLNLGDGPKSVSAEVSAEISAEISVSVSVSVKVPKLSFG